MWPRGRTLSANPGFPLPLVDNPYAAPVGALHAPSDIKPDWYAVTPLKLVVLSMCTLNVYLLYWHYSQWSKLKERRGDDSMPWARALFSIFFVTRLFEEVRAAGGMRGASLAAGPLAAGFIVVQVLDRVAGRVDLGPLGLVGLIAPFLIVPVQNEINAQLREADAAADLNGRFGAGNILAMCIGTPILILAFIGTFMPAE